MKSCCSVGTLWVLLEVPPHGGFLPWLETTGRVAEWCGRNAGRRSAGLGSEGAVQGQSHAVGVRARVRLPQAIRIRAEDVSGGNLWQWRAICAGGGHWRRFAFFCICKMKQLK